MASVRRQQAIRHETGLARCYSEPSDSLVVLAGQPAVDYVVDSLQAFARDCIADDGAPNTVAPAAAAVFGGGTGHGEVCWHMVFGPGQSCDVEVWTLAEVTPGVERWLHVETITGVVTDREYRSATRYRATFLRVINNVGFAALSPVPQRAAGV